MFGFPSVSALQELPVPTSTGFERTNGFCSSGRAGNRSSRIFFWDFIKVHLWYFTLLKYLDKLHLTKRKKYQNSLEIHVFSAAILAGGQSGSKQRLHGNSASNIFSLK